MSGVLGRIRRRLGSTVTKQSVENDLPDTSSKNEEDEIDLMEVMTPKAALAALDDGYYTEDFDPVRDLVTRLPLDTHKVPMFIMHDQMGKDVARDAVQSKLSQEVLANFNVFIQGMKHVQEVDLDITRATIHVGNSLRKLKEAREQLIKPSLQLCLWRRRRERLAAVRQRVQWVKTLIGAEARVRALLKQRDYVQAVQLCVATAVEMDSPRARAITVLDCGPRRRLQNMVPAIRKRLDEQLSELVGQFSAVAYDSTVQAYLLLDAATSASQSAADNDSGIVDMLGSTAATSASLSDAMMVTGATANLPATVQADVMDSIETITKDTVVAALAGTLEQNAALASRTGSFMDASAGAATTPSGVPLQELRDQSLPALCAQLQAHQVVPVMMRVYKLLTDQLYQHYLICQWHRRPFDRRNQDLAFLHRCGLDDNDPASPMPGDDADGSTGEAKGNDVGGGDGEADGVAAAGVASPGASVEPPTLGRRERAVLDHVARGLMQDRKVVWHRTQKRVGLMLNTACRALGTAQPVQAVQALVKLTEQFASVGEEYSGGDAPALRHSMQQFCSEYFGQVLQGATESLRTLLEMDTWQRMRVSIEKMGGIVGAVQRRRSVTSLQEAAAVAASLVAANLRASRSSATDRRVFPAMLARGNPFCEIASRGDDMGVDDNDSDDSDEVVDDDAAEVDEDDDDDVAGGSRSQRRQDRFGSHWVVTLASLNGFAASLGKLMNMMEALPSVAEEAFRGITQLFDTYVAAVTWLFVPADGVAALGAVRPTDMDPTHYDYLHPAGLRMGTKLAKLRAREMSDAVAATVATGSVSAAGAGGGAGAGAGAGAGGGGDAGAGDSTPNPESTDANGAQAMLAATAAARLAEAARLPTCSEDDSSAASKHVGGVYSLLHDVLDRVVATDGGLNLSPPAALSGASGGMEARCVGVESLDFLLDALLTVKSRIERLTPASLAAEVRQFYQDAPIVVHLLRSYTYHALAPLVFPEADTVPTWVSSVKWDGVKQCTESSDYVKRISDALKALSKRITALTDSGAVPDAAQRHVFACCVAHLYERFVEGVSRVRKCSTPGRGQMAMDITFINQSVCKILQLPEELPHDKRWVDEYIQAFYFTKVQDVMDWILHHRDAYALRHARSLLTYGVGTSLKKKKVREAVAQAEAVYGLLPAT